MQVAWREYRSLLFITSLCSLHFSLFEVEFKPSFKIELIIIFYEYFVVVNFNIYVLSLTLFATL